MSNPKEKDDAAVIVDELVETDILMGRGKRANARKGNVMLRQAAEAKAMQYASLTTKRDKRKFARDFIADIEATGARFLEAVSVSHEDSYKTAYQPVDRTVVEVKVKQLLRDRAAILLASKNEDRANTTGGLEGVRAESLQRPSLHHPYASAAAPRRFSMPTAPVSDVRYTQQLLQELANADRAQLRLQALTAAVSTGRGFPAAGVQAPARRASWGQSLPSTSRQGGISSLPVDPQGLQELVDPISTSGRAPRSAFGQEEQESSGAAAAGSNSESFGESRGSSPRHSSQPARGLESARSHAVASGMAAPPSWEMLARLELYRLREQQLANALLMGGSTAATNPAAMEALIAQQQQQAPAWRSLPQHAWTSASSRLDPSDSAPLTAPPASSSSSSSSTS